MTIRSEVRLNHKLTKETVARKIERKRERKRTFLKTEHAQHLGSTHSLSLITLYLFLSLLVVLLLLFIE